jgi:putative transposase
VTRYIEERRDVFGVEPICRTLGVSASAYYQRATGERSARRVEDERLVARIREVHSENFECYGYPRVWHELRRQGEQVGRDHVARLMRQEGIRGAKRRGKPWRTTIGDPAAHKRPDLVKRDFTAIAPDRLWVGDLTYLRSWEGRMYLAFLIDVFSRMIVGWQLASHMRKDLVLDALRMALGTRQPGADFLLVVHTDQGAQYTSEDHTQLLDDHQVLASVGTVGDCYDNALSESFVDSYKTELIADRVWRTSAQLEHATVRYIGWFNHRRLHSSIGMKPPVEHERDYWARLALGPEPLPAQAALTVTDLRHVPPWPLRGTDQSNGTG